MSIPPVVDQILRELIAGIGRIQKDFIEGIYLTGSIPLLDYYPGKSDIDFLVLCKELSTDKSWLQLQAVHQRIEQRFKHPNLNGSYLTIEGLNADCGAGTRTFSYHEKRLRASHAGLAPVTLYELKTTAINITGLPAQQLPITIDLEYVNRYMFSNINSYWKTWMDKHAALHRRGVLLILLPRLTEWVILGVARQLYTLGTGKIASKTAAGYYCLDHLPANYHWIIQQAIAIRTSKGMNLLELKPSYYVQPSVKRAVQTLDCAYFMIDQFNKEWNGHLANSR